MPNINIQPGGGGVSAGIVAMWTGTIANIPSGWLICDGNNGTHNMLAKFVEGVATAATNPGTTGGSTSKTTTGHTHTATLVVYGPGTSICAGANYSTNATGTTNSNTDTIADIRPLFYDVAFLQKT